MNTVDNFFAVCEKDRNEIHTLSVSIDGKTVLRCARRPYSCTDKSEVYSLSKSFTSTAIGFLYDDGLVSVSDRVCDIFPDKVPENPSDFLITMTVSDMLSMNTGHDFCTMPQIYNSPDPVSDFFKIEPSHKPGTHFAYNTGATLMLSAIVTKKTGMTVFEFLSRRLFLPLGITPSWNAISAGLSEGGMGLQISCDDILRFGEFCLARGVWRGKRLLSENWFSQAMSVHSDTSDNGSPDWSSGYGFQFWKCVTDGWRADGAFGQLCMVFPEYNAVAAVTAWCNNMQAEINAVRELVKALPEHPEDKAVAPDYPALPGATEPVAFAGVIFNLDPNPCGFGAAWVQQQLDSVVLCLCGKTQMVRIAAGAGEYAVSRYFASYRKPKLKDMMENSVSEEIVCAATYEYAHGVLHILVRHLCDPHTENITVTARNGRLKIDFGLSDYLSVPILTGILSPHQ